MTLPSVDTLDEYRAIYHREEVWRPAIREVCTRHSLPYEECVRGPDGTHIVYFAGPESVIKLFVPLFKSDFMAERLVAQVVHGRVGLATPEVTAKGEIDGWDYLIMTRLKGEPLEHIWSDLADDVLRRVMREVGAFIGSLREVSLDGLEPLASDWEEFVLRKTVARDEELSAVLPSAGVSASTYVRTSPLARSRGFRPALVLSDITREHLLAEQSGHSWRLTGYVDFGDAAIGPPEYELVAPGVELARGDRDLLRELLVAAGYSADQLNEELQRRLMTCTLVHRYLTYADLVSLIPAASAAETLDELAATVWPVC
ncbi:MAG: phosphotransferase [Candidatus Eisenbacteria bacterium]|nr:phosphotransferase [Candidatus Eisenbacteria bacterium]